VCECVVVKERKRGRECVFVCVGMREFSCLCECECLWCASACARVTCVCAQVCVSVCVCASMCMNERVWGCVQLCECLLVCKCVRVCNMCVYGMLYVLQPATSVSVGVPGRRTIPSYVCLLQRDDTFCTCN